MPLYNENACNGIFNVTYPYKEIDAPQVFALGKYNIADLDADGKIDTSDLNEFEFVFHYLEFNS